MSWKSSIQKLLSNRYHQPVTINNTSSVSGGSINETFEISTSKGIFFVKKNSASLFPGMFEKEAKG